MPGSASFFQQLGLFVLPDFFDLEFRLELCRQIAVAPPQKATVLKSNGEERLDLDSRNVDFSILPKETRSSLKQRLVSIQPALEKHFGERLATCEVPQCLSYRPGHFFTLHQDVGGYEAGEGIGRRRVSVVVFLNRQSQEPSEDAYGDGQLTFYGLLEGPHWEKCAFPLNAEPGLLIAFPSEKWHEVKPVSHGRRFTVVTWFRAPEMPTSLENG